MPQFAPRPSTHPLTEEQRKRKIANLRRRVRRIEKDQVAIRARIGDTLYNFATRCVARGHTPVVVTLDGDYCGGCHAMLPQQVLADVRSGAVAQCDTCSRIVYAAEIGVD